MAEAKQDSRSKDKPLTTEEEERVWDILHKRMSADDRYPAEVMMGPPHNGNRSAYLNTMRGCLNELSPP